MQGALNEDPFVVTYGKSADYKWINFIYLFPFSFIPLIMLRQLMSMISRTHQV